MRRIRLGNSSLNVSVLGLGGINFGTKFPEESAFRLMDLYSAAGGNMIDTSNNYAVWNGGDGGDSERVIGRWLTSRGKQCQMIIATKVGALPADVSSRDLSNMQGLSRDVILKSVENSLKNLQTDTIDLLYLHVDDFSVPQEEVMKTLNELIDSNVVKEIGCSNFYTWRLENARNICREHGYRFFCAIQQRYSYLSPAADADFFPQVEVNKDLAEYLKYYQDISLVAYSPLLGGQYNTKEIIKKEYRTALNDDKMSFLKGQPEPNSWVLNYIINSFGGSAALLTTSNEEHLQSILASVGTD